MIWYIQKNIPLGLRYLKSCMRQAGNLGPTEDLDRNRVLELLGTKIQQIDWESAKTDVRIFIADPDRLKIWTPKFFLDIIQRLQVE